jgi:hypothetical protein
MPLNQSQPFPAFAQFALRFLEHERRAGRTHILVEENGFPRPMTDPPMWESQYFRLYTDFVEQNGGKPEQVSWEGFVQEIQHAVLIHLQEVETAAEKFLGEEERAGYRYAPATDENGNRLIVDQWVEGRGFVPANPLESLQRLIAFLRRNRSSLTHAEVQRGIFHHVANLVH